MRDRVNNYTDKFRKHIRWLYLLASVLSFGIGGAVAVIGNSADNPLLIVLGFAGLVAGVVFFNKWRGQKEVRVIGKVLTKSANCLLVLKDRLMFAHLKKEKLLGLSQKCYNDGQYYHVHKIDKGVMTHFELPDDDESERYYDPMEMANVVSMPSNKKYFAWSATLMQTIKIGLMALVVAGELIGIIAME